MKGIFKYLFGVIIATNIFETSLASTEIEEIASDFINEINSGAPYMVYDFMRFDKAYIENSTLNIEYTLTIYDRENPPTPDLMKVFQLLTYDTYCKDELRFLGPLGLTEMSLSYFNSDDEGVAKMQLRPSDCDNQS